VAHPKLEAFLAANEPDPPPAPTEAPEPPAAPPASEPAPEPKPAPAPSEAPDAPDDDADVPERDGGPSVPRQALLDERSKRQNWVERASRAEALAEERRLQLEQLQKQREALARPQQPEQQFQFADPRTDPATYAAQQSMNAVFNVSELLARREHGDEVVDKLVQDFSEMASRDPMLWEKIRVQRDPFGWAHREMERQRLLREVGDDPSSYEKKLREKWEAERAAEMPPAVATPTNTPPPNMPPSLAGVRSVAGRAAQAWTGPPSDQQIAADIRAHRMAMRQR